MLLVTIALREQSLRSNIPAQQVLILRAHLYPLIHSVLIAPMVTTALLAATDLSFAPLAMPATTKTLITEHAPRAIIPRKRVKPKLNVLSAQ